MGVHASHGGGGGGGRDLIIKGGRGLSYFLYIFSVVYYIFETSFTCA